MIRRRHPEWSEHRLRWQWLLDSLEGGERYRQAIYGYDRRGLPIRNMIRHKREYPDPRESSGELAAMAGADPATLATDDDYELRRARTPPPTFVAEAVETHLSRIYVREVRRSGPEALTAWWADVDGCGTSIDQWMAETVAPLLMVLGQIDLCFDHPAPPKGEVVETRADQRRLGLDRCVASCILPEDMLWWRLDSTGQRYEECLVRELVEGADGVEQRYRHWTAEGSTLYTEEGEVLAEMPHPYGLVPIVRLFDRRKPRCRHTGQSRYEGIAERQREYYNRDSELILSDTTQAHPLLQGPEDFVQGDGTVPIGPSWLLPKKKNVHGGTATYEGFDVVNFPKDGAESLRKNKADLRQEVDRDSALVRPSGLSGAAQSGLSKLIDHADGNNRLAKVAKVLARSEQVAAELAWVVLNDGDVERGDLQLVQVIYPAEFDLYTAGDVASAASSFQSIAAQAGALPTTEALILSRLARLCLPGMPDAQYAACDEEITSFLEGRTPLPAAEKRGGHAESGHLSEP
ncbi:hypothetical protein EP7_005243 [Isosphaeraceae bacterium EP7]